MADRIRGITIEIGGDTTGLTKELGNVNKNIRSTQSQLKDVERLLKLDPSNTELLAQKQRLLTDAVKETKEKLDTLKEAERQAQQQFAEGRISQEQYDALQREIIETEQQLRNLEEQAERSNVSLQRISEAGQRLEAFGGKVTEAGQKLTVLSAGIAAVGTTSALLASNFEDAMAKVSTIADVTEVPLSDLKEQILSLSDETGLAATDIAENVYNAISAGQKTGDAVNFVSNAAKLAKAGFTDSASALDILTTTLNAYGLEASEVSNVSDKLITTQNLGKTTVDELASSMGKIIPTAKAQNVGLDDLCGAYAIMTSNGIATAETTTYLNSMLNELGKNGSGAANAFAEGTKHIKEGGLTMAEAMEQGWELSDILGVLAEQAEAGGTSLSNMFSSAEAGKAATVLWGNAEKLNDAISQMGESTGATETAFQKLDTTSNQVKIALNQIKNVGIDLGSTVLDTLLPMIQKLIEQVKNFSTWFQGLSNAQKEMIVKIGLVVAAIGPLLLVIGKVITVVGSMMAAVTALGPMLASAKASFAAVGAAIGGVSAPVLAVVAAVGTLIAVFVAMYATNEEFRAQVREVWLQVQQVIAMIVEQLQGIFQAFVALVNTLWAEWGDTILSVVHTAFDGIQGFIEGALNVIQGIIQTITSLIQGDWQGAWEGIKAIASGACDAIKESISTFIEILKTIFSAGFEFVRNTVSTAMDAVKTKVTEIWNSVKEFISTTVEGIKTKVSETFTAIVEGIREKVSGITNIIKNGFQGAIDFLTSLPGKALQWGKDFIQGFISGIQSKTGAVVSAVSNVAEQITARLHFTRPDIGPLRYYEEWMPHMMQGLAKGIRDNIDLVGSAVDATAGRIGQGLAAGLDDSIRQSKDYAKKSAEEISKAVLDMAQKRLKNHEVYNKITLSDEVDYWDAVCKQIEDGTQARIDADERYFKAKQNLNKNMQSAEEKYTSNIAKVYEDLNKKIQDLNKKYQDAVNTRTDEIKNSFSLFDNFSMDTDLTADQLLGNLQSQVDGLRQWRKNLKDLERRGIGDDLLAELEGLGPKAAAEIQLMTEMSNAQLDEYASLFRSKNRIARQQAVAELEPMREEIAGQIEQMRRETSSELYKCQQEYRAAMAELGAAFNQPLEVVNAAAAQNATALVTTIADTVREASGTAKNMGKFKEIVDNVMGAVGTLLDGMRSMGHSAIDSFIAGLKDKEGELYAAVQGIMQRAMQAIPDVLSLSGSMENYRKLAVSTAHADMEPIGTTGGHGDSGVLQLLNQYLPDIADQKYISLDGTVLVGKTAGRMDQKLGESHAAKGRIN